MVLHPFSGGRRALRHCDRQQLSYFMPKAATIAPHAPIRWENTTGSHHTITHEGCERGSVCVFDSGMLAPDRSYELAGLPLSAASTRSCAGFSSCRSRALLSNDSSRPIRLM